MRKYTLLLCLYACLLHGQAPNVLTNDTIVKLVQAGVPRDTIIRMIAAAESVDFRFVGPDLQRLTDTKVPDEVFKAMYAKSNGRPIPGFSVAASNPDVAERPAVNIVSVPRIISAQPKTPTPVTKVESSTVETTPADAAQDSSPSCAYFTVVMQDTLNNVKQGLSVDDAKWFQKNFARKYPGVCYAEPDPTVPIVFYITVAPDVYHGTRIVNQTSTHSDPLSGTVTDQRGNSAQVDGTVRTTTTSSTAVPYSVDYGIYTLSVERRKDGGQFEVVHRFQQKGLYRTLTFWGFQVFGSGKGKHPVHAVIEEATKWVSSGGLTDPRQAAF